MTQSKIKVRSIQPTHTSDEWDLFPFILNTTEGNISHNKMERRFYLYKYFINPTKENKEAFEETYSNNIELNNSFENAVKKLLKKQASYQKM